MFRVVAVITLVVGAGAADAGERVPNECVRKFGPLSLVAEVADGAGGSYFLCNVRFDASHEMYQSFLKADATEKTKARPRPVEALLAAILKDHKLSCPRGTSVGVFKGFGDPEGSLVCWIRMSRTGLCPNGLLNVYAENFPCVILE